MKNNKEKTIFLSSPTWLERSIAFFSIKKMIVLSILSVVIAFILLITVFSIETLVISTHQKSIADRVLPSIATSRDIRKGLSSFERLQRNISTSSLTTIADFEKLVAPAIAQVTHKTNQFALTKGNDVTLAGAHDVFVNNINEIKRSFHHLLTFKKEALSNQLEYEDLQVKADVLFDEVITLSDEINLALNVNKNVYLSRSVVRFELVLIRLNKIMSKFDVMQSTDDLFKLREGELKRYLIQFEQQASLIQKASELVGVNQSLKQNSQALLQKTKDIKALLLGNQAPLYQSVQQKIELELKMNAESNSIALYLKEMDEELKALTAFSENQTIGALKDLGFVTSWSGWVLVLSIGLLMLILIMLMSTILRKINKPIDVLSSAMHSLSVGDLAVRLPKKMPISAEFSGLWHDFNRFALRAEQLVNEQKIILDNADIGIAWLRNRKFLRVNSKFLDIFQANEEDVIGKSSEQIFSEKKSYIHLATHADAVLKHGGAFSKEYKMKRISGGDFLCKLSGKSTGGESAEESVWIFEDVTERKLAEQELQTMANYDSLTGLPNRAMFNQFVDQAIQRSKRNNTEFAIFFIDLDRFKHINDSQGHDAGDFVLREVANRMQGVVRESDVVARLGGDEFTLIIDAIYSRPSVEIIAKKILSQLARQMIYNDKEFFVGGSIGISLYPEHGNERGELMSNADAAMYVSKESGRNTYNFFDKKISNQTGAFIELSQALRTAVSENEFELHYQPQVDLDTNKIIGMEALLRWTKPRNGLLVPPVEFIPILEEIGLMPAVGEWVINEAGKAYANWTALGLQPGRIAVNLSERQFATGDLRKTLINTIEQEKIPASALELEITEGLLIDESHSAIKVLEELKALGFKIALDDFGTGYSSLSYLKRFPIDTIKVDRSFIRDMLVDKDDEVILDAILVIAKQLKLNVVAEGVETKEQLASLQSKGCDLGQGYLFSRPVKFEEMTALLKKDRSL